MIRARPGVPERRPAPWQPIFASNKMRAGGRLLMEVGITVVGCASLARPHPLQGRSAHFLLHKKGPCPKCGRLGFFVLRSDGRSSVKRGVKTKIIMIGRRREKWTSIRKRNAGQP